MWFFSSFFHLFFNHRFISFHTNRDNNNNNFKIFSGILFYCWDELLSNLSLSWKEEWKLKTANVNKQKQIFFEKSETFNLLKIYRNLNFAFKHIQKMKLFSTVSIWTFRFSDQKWKMTLCQSMDVGYLLTDFMAKNEPTSIFHII